MKYPINLTKNKPKVLAVIPARSGSTRIKNKNIKYLNGRPLISYTIKESLKSIYITDVCVTSDSPKILNISKKYGINNIIRRTKNLSTKLIPTYPVVLDAMQRVEKIKKIKYDFLLLLQPTSPFRTHKDIDTCLKKLFSSKIFDSVVSVTDVGGAHPLRMKKIKNGKLINFIKNKVENMQPIQSLEKVYIRNGAIYIINRNNFLRLKSLVGNNVMPFIMDKNKSINIDDEIDFELAKIIQIK